MFIHDEQMNAFNADVRNVAQTRHGFYYVPISGVLYMSRWIRMCRHPDFIM